MCEPFVHKQNFDSKKKSMAERILKFKLRIYLPALVFFRWRNFILCFEKRIFFYTQTVYFFTFIYIKYALKHIKRKIPPQICKSGYKELQILFQKPF